MNLFRSEEHARTWDRFDPEFERYLKPISFWLELFSGKMFRARSRSDFISWLGTDDGKE